MNGRACHPTGEGLKSGERACEEQSFSPAALVPRPARPGSQRTAPVYAFAVVGLPIWRLASSARCMSASRLL